ncbi:hypothetical protein C7447_102555 [Tenacibaculum adriaticum]|uniref:Uncharacterized protein n=1 Tax=Tenacibaculum adriaticum TaxID=413713 RepID=A0A5S5DTG1_9FLAO|nr:hypothetical protein [Tenacibaculum adriaticum]TYP99233.1 hypothetical protein C7447_102555 [Tenacibaculum adriaticum]
MLNKKYFIIFILIVTNFATNGQTATLSAGGWRTSNNNPFTRITGSNNLATKIYRIECTALVDTSILQFRIIVDGTPIQATFQEGSYVVVEGKQIAIEQLSQGTMVRGAWTIIQEPEIAATTVPWNYYPSLSNDLLVASLKVEQEFLISINYSTINCSNTSFNVFINGQPVKDTNNNTLIFLEGSTVYGKGKSILIRATGACTNNMPIVGDLKLAK